MPKALLLENIHPDAAKSLRDHGFEVETMKGGPERGRTHRCAGWRGLGGRTPKTTSLPACWMRILRPPTLLHRHPIRSIWRMLRQACIACSALPLNTVRGGIGDLRHHLAVPHSHIISMACGTSPLPVRTVRGETLGIIGYGNNAPAVGYWPKALAPPWCSDIEEKLALGNAHRCDTLNELLEQSDAVTLHVDGRKSNTGFFGEANSPT